MEIKKKNDFKLSSTNLVLFFLLFFHKKSSDMDKVNLVVCHSAITPLLVMEYGVWYILTVATCRLAASKVRTLCQEREENSQRHRRVGQW